MPRTVLMAQRFFEQAEHDIEFARRIIEIGGYDIAANLAHQAAEKALKAAHWHLRAEEPEWGHHLIGVATRVAERADGLPTNVDEALGVLAPFFERTRYPSGRVDEPIPARLVQAEDAREAVTAAEEIVAWGRSLLQRVPGRPGRRPRSSPDTRV